LSVGTARKTTRSISDFQKLMAHTYLARDQTRGLDWVFKRLNDVIMELRMAIEKGKKREISAESADVFAWLALYPIWLKLIWSRPRTRSMVMDLPNVNKFPVDVK